MHIVFLFGETRKQSVAASQHRTTANVFEFIIYRIEEESYDGDFVSMMHFALIFRSDESRIFPPS